MNFHLSIWSTQVRYPSKWEWEAEKVLAGYGLPYRAQYPCGKYFIDLALPQYRLAIEIDDQGHGSKANKLRDAEKTAWLEALGWEVIRLNESDMAESDTWKEHIDASILDDNGPVSTRRCCEDPFEFRGDYYARRAKERKAKKLKAASKTPKAPAKVSRKRSPAAKPALG